MKCCASIADPQVQAQCVFEYNLARANFGDTGCGVLIQRRRAAGVCPK